MATAPWAAPWTTTPSMIVDKELQLYLAHIEARLQDAQDKLTIAHHKKKEAKNFVVKTQDQLQDCNHLVCIAQATMVALEKELKHVLKMRRKRLCKK